MPGNICSLARLNPDLDYPTDLNIFIIPISFLFFHEYNDMPDAQGCAFPPHNPSYSKIDIIALDLIAVEVS